MLIIIQQSSMDFFSSVDFCKTFSNGDLEV